MKQPAYKTDPTLLDRPYTRCIQCGEPFTEQNVHTVDGWGETQISGECEDCFDELFKDES